MSGDARGLPVNLVQKKLQGPLSTGSTSWPSDHLSLRKFLEPGGFCIAAVQSRDRETGRLAGIDFCNAPVTGAHKPRNAVYGPKPDGIQWAYSSLVATVHAILSMRGPHIHSH